MLASTTSQKPGRCNFGKIHAASFIPRTNSLHRLCHVVLQDVSFDSGPHRSPSCLPAHRTLHLETTTKVSNRSTIYLSSRPSRLLPIKKRRQTICAREGLSMRCSLQRQFQRDSHRTTRTAMYCSNDPSGNINVCRKVDGECFKVNFCPGSQSVYSWTQDCWRTLMLIFSCHPMLQPSPPVAAHSAPRQDFQQAPSAGSLCTRTTYRTVLGFPALHGAWLSDSHSSSPR